MPFPASDRVVYERNPLERVICQLRFPSILKIASQEPAEFQDLVRGRYPLYKHLRPPEPELPKELSEFLSGVGLARGGVGKHDFGSEDKKQTIALTKDFVAFTDVNYERWERFIGEVRTTKDALETAYEPAFYSRVGLRFCDVIDREELDLGQTPWTDLLRDVLLGFLHDEGLRGRIAKASTELAIELDEPPGSLMAIRHGLAKRADGSSDVYSIDVDCSISGKVKTDDVIPALESFHRISVNFFRWAITSHLRNALRPRPLD